MQVVGYTRVSTQEQALEGMGLAAQRGRIEAWCAATGAELTGVVEDAGVSGTKTLGERPGGAQIAEMLRQRRPTVAAVVVARLDRLGRDASETLALIGTFATGSVGLVSVADRIDFSTPQGKAMAGVSAIFAELERDLIAQRTSEALRELRAQGRAYGPVPFGFRRVGDALVAQSEEQSVLARINRLRRRGRSYAAIATSLNRAGIPAKRGGRWHAGSVRSVLRTSALVGVAEVHEVSA